MTQTRVPKLIMELSVPTIISMLVTGIYNSADTYFVGRISTNATAAVGVVYSVMALIQLEIGVANSPEEVALPAEKACELYDRYIRAAKNLMMSAITE